MLFCYKIRILLRFYLSVEHMLVNYLSYLKAQVKLDLFINSKAYS